MVEIWLPYGATEVPVRIPDENLIDILQPRTLDKSPEKIADNLVWDDVIATAKTHGRVCIVIGDNLNKEAIGETTKSLVTVLTTHAGLPAASLTIIRTPHCAAIDGLPPDIQDVQHSPINSSTVPCEGFSERDFAPSINQILINSPVTIAVGELRLNHLTGFAGLSDTIFPGLASQQSADDELVRSKPMDPHDLCKERLLMSSHLPNVFALGYVLNSDLSPKEAMIGPFNATVERLCELVRQTSMVEVSKPADIVVMSAGGSPFDESLLRAVETFPAGLSVLKRGGALIVAAECARGHGDSDFFGWLAEKKEARHLEARLRHHFNFNGWKAAFLARALASHRIYLVSTIPDHHIEHTFGLRAAKTMNAALQSAQRALGNDASITAIPNASQVNPIMHADTGSKIS